MLLARRAVLHSLGAAAALLPVGRGTATLAAPPVMRRVRPGDPDWPSPTAWEELNRAVGRRMIKVKPLLATCEAGSNSGGCNDLLHNLRDPYFIDEQPAGTESSGWIEQHFGSPPRLS